MHAPFQPGERPPDGLRHDSARDTGRGGPAPWPGVYVAVIGPGEGAARALCALAEQVGRQLAQAGAIVVCGGLGGVMAAASKGAADCGGQAIGLLPGTDRAAGNQFLSATLPTGLGELRNGLIVRASDAVIAIGGSWGTLSEIALAMRTGKPTVVVGGWEIEGPDEAAAQGLLRAASAREAVALALTRAGRPARWPQ